MSSSDVVIRVQGLGKKYSLHHQQAERDTHLRDLLARQARAAGRLLNPFTLAGQLRKVQRQATQIRDAREEEFWALKDVSIEIRRGERVGIIGRNGAGKSTLLKILSRIIEPTTGRVEICGRVASLLEVGTGFHPELTGRENIYLNGAILGMTRREIKAKFDEIVDFSEVEKFLDTPVKRYSSGMYVRLAFAVAAHLEPEILVVDEVLAVGDASFQKKCLGKMSQVSSESNRTIFFVSHNMQAVGSLCDRAILLRQGEVCMDSEPQRSISAYINEGIDLQSVFKPCSSMKSIPEAHINQAQIDISESASVSRYTLTIELVAYNNTDSFYLTVLITSAEGTVVAFYDSRDSEKKIIDKGVNNIVLDLDIPLQENYYYISLGLSSTCLSHQYSYDNCLKFYSTYRPRSRRPINHNRPGFLNLIDFIIAK